MSTDMKRLLSFLFFLLIASCCFADGNRIRFTSDVLFRFERQQFPDSRDDVDRYRLRWRPGLFFQLHPSFDAGIEAEINWIDESDEDLPLPGFSFPQFHTPVFDRDNFKRDDIVLSKAFLKFAPSPRLEILGGKFENPFSFSEMLWDHDLRPNGGVVSVSYESANGSILLTGRAGDFYATHYLHDRTNVIAFQGVVQSTAGISTWSAAVSYYDYNVKGLDPSLLRGNTRAGARLLNDYNLLDFIARLRFQFSIPVTAQIDFVTNRAAKVFTPGMAGNGDYGYLFEFFIGQLQNQGNVRFGYAHHRVKSDAVLAAYNTDDWWFPTRGEGYRLTAGVMVLSSMSIQASYLSQTLVEQSAKFKRLQISAEFNWP